MIMKHVFVILGACILSLAITSTQSHEIWASKSYLIKRTNIPPKKYSQPGGQSQPGRPVEVKRDKSPSSSAPRRPASPNPGEAQVSVDIHGPGKYSGLPNPQGSPFQNNIKGGQRQFKTYRDSEEAFAVSITLNHLPALSLGVSAPAKAGAVC